MSKPRAAVRAAGWVTVGAVVAGGVGVAGATTNGGSHSGSHAGTAVTAAAVTPTAATPTPPTAAKGKHAKHGKIRREIAGKLSARLLHGQATVLGKDGKPVQIAEQRGSVAAVSPASITLTSKDGFKQTYVVTKDTRVRVAGKKSAIADVKAGQQAGVLAKVSGGAQTASVVIERPAKAGAAS